MSRLYEVCKSRIESRLALEVKLKSGRCLSEFIENISHQLIAEQTARRDRAAMSANITFRTRELAVVSRFNRHKARLMAEEPDPFSAQQIT